MKPIKDISNEHTHKIDVIKEISTTYYMAKALHYQMRYIRDYLNKDFKKMLSEAAAKNNHFCSQIEQYVPMQEQDALDEITMQILEAVNNIDFNQRVDV